MPADGLREVEYVPLRSYQELWFAASTFAVFQIVRAKDQNARTRLFRFASNIDVSTTLAETLEMSDCFVSRTPVTTLTALHTPRALMQMTLYGFVNVIVDVNYRSVNGSATLEITGNSHLSVVCTTAKHLTATRLVKEAFTVVPIHASSWVA
ncbi:hypothetical protein FHETE_10171 [Fusarium heterosporum]|uniref:Uncharacterized protein n=1 Tax=Fusarium heterosporum TaxID=42747 RepID=A0A8H5SVM0_FUSHE|nr:hypothetical protein FHETE_10171 [Fusarium heterosporum]